MSKQTVGNEQILNAARELFIEQGFRKTSMEEIAHRAGVSRVTIYRHYSGKKELVRAVSEQAEGAFRRISVSVAGDAMQNPGAIIDLFQNELGKLSSTSFLGRFDELHRVYPDIFEEYRAARKAALDAIFDHVLATLKQGGMLRKGINETVLRHVFFGSIVNAVQNPDLAGLDIPREEILRTIREVFLHGVLDIRGAGDKQGPRPDSNGGSGYGRQ